MDKLYWLDQIKSRDRTKVGDKAFHLSRIMQRGFPVLPGFVVSAEALREFLETLNSSESLVADLPHSSLHIDVDNWRQLQQVAGRLRQEIITANLPPSLLNTIFQAAKQLETSYLILRPTLVAPTAKLGLEKIYGLLESQVCRCEEPALATALKRTWSQIFRAKSLFYWQWAGMDLQQINLGVLVQPLRNGIASGLLNANTPGWEILSTWGLGMAILHGQVLPDAYYIQPGTGTVQERQLGNKMVAYHTNDTDVATLQLMSGSAAVQSGSCLVTTLLEEEKQKNYALPEETLQQLIQLTSQLVGEIGTHFTLEWTISGETTELYITQISTPPSAIPNFHFIKGLGAATGRVTANAYVINSQQKPHQLPKGVVLVAPSITPDWLPLLQQVSGIITEHGGLTSHAAILARELGIPAVVNLADATVIIQPGERLYIDGTKGEVYRITIEEENLELNSPPSPLSPRQSPQRDGQFLSEGNTWTYYPREPPQAKSSSPTLTPPLSPYPSITPQLHLPIIATRLLVNLSQPGLIEQAQSLPVDGVGLLRSELMVLNILDGQHPSIWLREGRQTQLLERWRDMIIQFARAFAPKPVFYRCLDWRSHELPSLSGVSQSPAQSMLGERGTFSYTRNPAIFELELAALAVVQKAGYENIHLLLPFVRTVEEFTFCRQKVEQAKLTQVPHFQLWIMAEVPSVLFLLSEYVKAGVQGISIGTNDLTQLLLGVDREQGQLATVFDERHPVVMSAVAQLIKMAKDTGIPCSICGQAPVLYPEIIEQLVRWGITSISVEPEAVERTYIAIARAEQRIILEVARRQLNQ